MESEEEKFDHFQDLDSLDRVERPRSGSQAWPAPRSPALRQAEEEPARGPVEIRDLDPEKAKKSLRSPISLAAEVCARTDPFDMTKIIEATVDVVVERAGSGKPEQICLTELAERAKIGRGRIGEHFGVHLAPFANLVVRGVYGKAGRRVYYEELGSHAAANVGRRSNSFGTDKVAKMPNSLHFLDHSLSSSDRHCPVGAEALGVGTRWDPASDRSSHPLPGWTQSYPGSFPAGFLDHVERTIGVDRAARHALLLAMDRGIPRYPDDLSEKQMEGAFSSFLALPLIPYGTPLVGHRDHAAVYRPGRDDQLVSWAGRSGRHVVLACGDIDPDERERFESESERLSVGRLPSMYELGLRREYEVDYRWSKNRQELGRYVVGNGAKLETWRLVGVSSRPVFWRMVSVVERLAQVAWTRKCTMRWEQDCRPGALKAHRPESCTAVRSLLAIANAGIVDALRQAAWDEEFERGE